jgi:MraZ protein
VARFIGRYEHSLDAKGRVILPAKFRSEFEHGGFLSQHQEGCLALWTPPEFDTQLETVKAKADAGSQEDRNLARVWASGSSEVEVDKSGRMPIPAYLRQFARLASDVLVIGAIDRIELWSPQVWEEKVLPSEQQLQDS